MRHANPVGQLLKRPAALTPRQPDASAEQFLRADWEHPRTKVVKQVLSVVVGFGSVEPFVGGGAVLTCIGCVFLLIVCLVVLLGWEHGNRSGLGRFFWIGIKRL